MASDSDEVEIKIEYNESFDVDPLSGNIVSKATERSNLEDVMFRFTQANNVETEQLGKDPSDNIKDHLDQVSSSNDTEDKMDFSNVDLCTRDHSTGMINENEATWYKEIDSSGRFLCRFCDLNYSTVQTLRHHIKTTHPTEAKQLKNHILNNKRDKKPKCHICKARFKLITDLKDHVNQKHSLENIETSCANCDATFLNSKDMLEHLFYKHNVVKKQIFFCDICGYRTLKRSHYSQHKNTHLKEKDMKCKFCDYSTNYSPNLKIHERIHTNDKPYVCHFESCEYSCSAKSALRSHQLKHNRQHNMLYCDQCSYSTVYKQSLKKHTESHRRNSIKMKVQINYSSQDI